MYQLSVLLLQVDGGVSRNDWCWENCIYPAWKCINTTRKRTPVSSPDMLPQWCINIVSCFNYFIMIMPHRKTLELVSSQRILKVGALMKRLITHTLVSAICRLSFALRQPVSRLQCTRVVLILFIPFGVEEEAAVAVGVLVLCMWRSAQRSAGTTGGPGQLVVRRGDTNIGGKIFTGRGSNCKRLAV